MGPDIVVVGDPFGDEAAGVRQPEKQGLVEELVPHAAIEALAEAILHRLRVSELPGSMSCHSTLASFAQARIAFEVNPVP